MDRQLQFKIINLTHQRDEMLETLKLNAEELSDLEVEEIIHNIIKINKTLKKLTNG